MDIHLTKLFTLRERMKMKNITETVASEFQAKHIVDEVIEPVIARVNKACGQEMNATYLAYACIYYQPWPTPKR